LATKAFRIALLATGIGAVVVLLGALVSAMANVGDETDETTEKIKRQNDALEKHKELVKGEADANADNRKMRAGGLNDMERELKLMKARGASAKEIFTQEQKILQEQRNILNERLGYVSGNAAEEQKIQDELRNNTNAIEENKLAFYKKIQDDKLKLNGKVKDEEKKIELSQQDEQVKAYEKWKEEEEKKFFEELERQVLYYQTVEDLNKKNAEEERKIAEEKAAEFLRIEQQAFDARLSITKDGLNALSDITDAFTGKNEQGQRRAFAINKALNISTTLIDTYTAAQKAYLSQLSKPTADAPVRANIAAGVSIASG
jgi:hypothetical protein